MCGICGVYDTNSPPSSELALRMMAGLGHRGPDGSGYYLDDTVALGHTRLSIIDLEGGVQPMAGTDERVWVTFNGVIFNYLELRQELASRGHRFHTTSDTEVIVHAWEEWGPGCFVRFNGQWAMAIWDRRSSELILSRDRYGIHPLFHTRVGERLFFASEIKSLFSAGSVHRELDPRGVDQLLTFWSAIPPRTVFAGVSQVVPGTYVRISGSGESVHQYWAPSFPEGGGEPNQDLDENAERLRAEVIRATRLRYTRSDVPVGAYLSGGIDSAVTAATIAEFTGADVHTFSLRFGDDEFDEGGHQALMSRRLGTTHREVMVTERDIAGVLPEAVWHAESGLLRAAPAPMLLLSRLVREEGYKVVVTGEGADEVLAGYDIFREARVRLFLSRDPDSESRARAIDLLYPWLRRSPNLAPSFARSFFGAHLDPDDPAMSHRPRWEATAALKPMLAGTFTVPDPRAAADDVVAGMPADASAWDPLSRAQWLEIRTLLSGYLLSAQGDRMLMANAVEGRFPFLDHELFELAATFPARHKILGLDEKHLLKRAFADLVPREIIERPKQPYRAPDAASLFAGGSPAWLDDVTSTAVVERAGIFKPVVVSKVIDKCRRRQGRDLSNTDNMRLMAVVSLQLLESMFVSNWVAPTAGPPAPVTVFDRRGLERNTSDD